MNENKDMATKQKMSRDVEVFFSYSRKDEDLRNELEKHLSILKHQGVISTWHDRKIDAGDEWKGVIDEHLDSARVILLLISPDFMAARYTYDIEMIRALERHRSGTARVIPVILRPVDWDGAPFSKLQALPTNVEPVTKWVSRDDAFLDIEKGIKKVIEQLNDTNDMKEITEKANYSNASKTSKKSREKKADKTAPNLQSLLKCLYDDGCYLPEGHYRLPSGKHSERYIQARIGMMNLKTRSAFAASMIDRLNGIECTMLAAGTVGGILLAKEAARLMGVPLLVGRKYAGTFAWVNIKDQQPDSFRGVVLVDDILSTGGTLESEIRSIESEIRSQSLDGKIIAAVVAVNRSIDGKNKIEINEKLYNIMSLLPRALIEYDPGENTCPRCPDQIINLYEAENDIIQTIKSMPPEKADMIISGYIEAYELQQDERALILIKQLGPLLIAARICFGQHEAPESFGSIS